MRKSELRKIIKECIIQEAKLSGDLMYDDKMALKAAIEKCSKQLEKEIKANRNDASHVKMLNDDLKNIKSMSSAKTYADVTKTLRKLDTEPREDLLVALPEASRDRMWS